MIILIQGRNRVADKMEIKRLSLKLNNAVFALFHLMANQDIILICSGIGSAAVDKIHDIQSLSLREKVFSFRSYL